MRWIGTTLKITLWTLLAAVLLVLGLAVCTVRTLRPEHITPLASRIANQELNADVSIGRIELRMRGTLPFVTLTADSIVVVSRDIKALTQAERDTLPQWADTLATVGRLHGGVNLALLVRGRVSLSDVVIDRPNVNVLVVNDSLNNFSIARPSTESSSASSELPDVRISSFKITNPGPLRYIDLASGMHLTAQLDTAEIIDQTTTDTDLPSYRVDFSTNIESPLFSTLGLSRVPVAFDGIVDWHYKQPYELTLSNFRYKVSYLRGTLGTCIDFTDQMLVRKLDITVEPLDVSQLLRELPDDVARRWGVPRGIGTDAKIGLDVRLDSMYVAGSDDLPYITLSLHMPQSHLLWGKVDIRRMELEATATVRGNALDDATIDIDRLVVAGPATTITADGTLSRLLSDPTYAGYINGRIRLEKLPPVLTALLKGAMAKGTVAINTSVEASRSMFSRNGFHLLRVRGDIDVTNFYYLAADTLMMFAADHAHAKFGTNETGQQRTADSGHTRTRQVDSLLTAQIAVDSTRIMAGGLDIRVGDFRLGVGAQNRNTKADTTAIIPMGGRLHVGSFSLFTLADTAGVRMRSLNGRVSMMRYKGDAHLPQFMVDAKLGLVSAGNNYTRVMVQDGNLSARLHKMPDSELTEQRRQVKQVADSIRRVRPDIPIDSVYALALEIRRRHSSHQRHVRTELTASDQEIIEWGTSQHFQRFLLDWDLSGSLTATRAGLYTSSFPLRNRLDHLDVRFTNDSIIVTDLAYKAGHTDLLVSGCVSNMRRAFTSRRPQPIKINFDMLSDTIDVNGLAHAFFTGAAARHKRLEGDLATADLDSAMSHEAAHQADADSVGPLLIPVNIDAQFNIKANNVLYSDLLLHDLSGSVLAYDGALNLHDLRASSDVGSIDISALYCAPSPRDMKFGMGLELDRFNIRNFLTLVPAIDSLMPMMRDLGGIVSAKIAATADVDDQMNLVLPTLDAALSIAGDSLVVIDPDTYKSIAKWLMFKDKNHNMINHIEAEMVIKNDMLQIYPFVFDFDRYRLGIQGHNDLDMNCDYHVAVLKSPLPFKFGVNIKGKPGDLKVRLGKARFNERDASSQVAIADTTRVNLIRQFQNVFRRGVRNSRFARIEVGEVPLASQIDLSADTISRSDSLYLIKEGLLPEMKGD